MPALSKPSMAISWVCRLAAAVIMLQTLFFKFTAAPESVFIFSEVGKFAHLPFMEPWGRIGTGVAELIASLLILVPATTWLGALVALGIMGGAITTHLFILGIQVQGDHGTLFGLAVAVSVCSVVLLFLNRRTIPVVGQWLK